MVKRELISTHSSHFAGGKHAFLCMAKTLARDQGHSVHIITLSSKAQLLVACGAASPSAPPFHALMPSPASPNIVSWSEALDTTREDRVAGSLTFHAVLSEGDETEMVGAIRGIERNSPMGPTGASSFRLIIDADDSQQRTSSSSLCLFASLVSRIGGSKCLALVQNVHFLPFGPSGSSFRTTELLTAWKELKGVVCVSQFVKKYLLGHSNLDPEILSVTHLSTWSCFGEAHKDFPDYGLQVISNHRVASASGSPLRAKIGVLKLTIEKGLAIVLELARRMTDVDFLVVAGDPNINLEVSSLSLLNITVIDPVDDVDLILSKVDLILAPSLWLEAWGMVVTESLLRGVPVIVSDAGGLSEAGLGICPTLHVECIEIPIVQGTPDWASRSYPKQDVGPWEGVIRKVLGSLFNGDEGEGSYLWLSRHGRRAALEFIKRGEDDAREFELRLLSSL